MLLTGPDFPQANPLNCAAIIPPAGGTNFSDGPANYLPNMDEIITFCPDLTQGSKVSIAFATNIGFTFNIHPTDTLYVFDGPSISAPLIGAYNPGTSSGHPPNPELYAFMIETVVPFGHVNAISKSPI